MPGQPRESRVQQLFGAQGTPAADESQAETAEAGEAHTAAYGYYRGVRDRASDLVFDKRDGTSPSLGYAWLYFKDHRRAGDGQGRGALIVLEYTTGEKVEIRGRNLQPLYEQLHRRRVFRITELGEEEGRFLPPEATVVYTIDVQRRPQPSGPALS
jgi:hypothetical protein